MQNYESMVIVRSTLTEEEVNAALAKIREMIEKGGGTILQAEGWGKRRLAYEIQGEKKGAYLLFRFRADGKLISLLEHQYRLDETILKFMTVRLEGPLPTTPAPATAADKKPVPEKAAPGEAASV